MTNILFISPDFNYSCGVSKHVFLLLSYFKKQNKHNVHFITNGGDSLERLVEIGVQPIIICFRKGLKNIFHLLPNIMFITKYCLKHRIEIIHTHHRYPEFVCFIVSKMIKVKTITTVHSLVSGFTPFSFLSNRIIAVSESVKSMLIDNYRLDKAKIHLSKNYIPTVVKVSDSEKELFKMELGINRDQKIILFVGRICYDKGVDILVASFIAIQKEIKDLVLLIVGESETEFDIPGGSQNNPFIKKILPTKNIERFYSIADIVVLPSRIDSFPFVMLESGLYKLPFIGGDTGGIKEFIRHMESGLLVKPGDALDLGEKIKMLIKNEELSKKLGEQLYTDVLPLTDEEKYFNNLENVYFKD